MRLAGHIEHEAEEALEGLQAEGMIMTLVGWQANGYSPDIVVLSTGMWSLLGLGSPVSFAASLRALAYAFSAWHSGLVRHCITCSTRQRHG
jgi:hypothetical protein